MELYLNVYNPTVSYLKLDSFVIHDRSHGSTVDVYLTSVVVFKSNFLYLAVVPTELIVQKWIVPTGSIDLNCVDHIAFALADFVKTNPFVRQHIKQHTSHLNASYVARFRASIACLERYIINEARMIEDINYKDLLKSIMYLKNAIKLIKSYDLNVPYVEEELTAILSEEAHKRFQSRKAIIIQTVWRHCISDPSHQICKRRLDAEFRGLAELMIDC